MPDQPDIVLEPAVAQQPDIVLEPQHVEAHVTESILPEQLKVQTPPPSQGASGGAKIAFICSLLGIASFGLSFRVQFFFLISILFALLGIMIAISVEVRKQPGDKLAVAAIVVGGLTLLLELFMYIATLNAATAI